MYSRSNTVQLVSHQQLNSEQEITDTGKCVQQTFCQNTILILIVIDFILDILRLKMF
jgi:hypothetical protein